MKEEFTTSARRWYDKDPVLSSAMKTLEESDDDTQIKIALNLIQMVLRIQKEKKEEALLKRLYCLLTMVRELNHLQRI